VSLANPSTLPTPCVSGCISSINVLVDQLDDDNPICRPDNDSDSGEEEPRLILPDNTHIELNDQFQTLGLNRSPIAMNRKASTSSRMSASGSRRMSSLKFKPAQILFDRKEIVEVWKTVSRKNPAAVMASFCVTLTGFDRKMTARPTYHHILRPDPPKQMVHKQVRLLIIALLSLPPYLRRMMPIDRIDKKTT
jgi:hypothetical protein